MRREAFDDGEIFTPDNPMQGDAWEFPELGIELRIHPLYLVDPHTFGIADLFFQCKAMGGSPEGGGQLDQPAWLMGAFDVCEHAFNKLTTKPKRKGK